MTAAPLPLSVRRVAREDDLGAVTPIAEVLASGPRSDDSNDYEPAFTGIAGEFVALVYPHTESDRFALLTQFLAAFGNVIGRTAYQRAESDKHYCNLFVTLVGNTSKGRKGTSWARVRTAFEYVDDDWARSCHFTGVSTGEGLIHHLRDPREERDGKGNYDSGVIDKRAFVIASEFASILQVMQRSGATLSATLRDAWDRGDLRTMTKGSAERATGAHVSVVAHITRDELRRSLTSTETANGFANRFLWVEVHRSKLLPEGGALDDTEVLAFATTRLAPAVAFARTIGCLQRDDAARQLWSEIYARLSQDRVGLLGSVTSRAEAQVLRLSTIYALLDRSDVVRRDHLEAAYALWRYCDRSAREVFAKATGDPVADAILAEARVAKGVGIRMTDIHNIFGRHHSVERLNAALKGLIEEGRLTTRTEQTGGRPATWYVATGSAE